MIPVAENPVIVPDHELEEEKKLGESERRASGAPPCGWSPAKEDKWFCTCGNGWNSNP
jgi:hypothetical protein